MADRQRQTNRWNFRGLNTRLLADAMPIGKSPVAINVRASGDSKVRTRPGYVAGFSTGSVVLTDIGSYATLGTDNKPRVIAHDSGGGIWLDNGVQVGRVGTGGPGASLIPFRPNQSPQSWMYIGNLTGYEKYSAPDGSNTVIQQKGGIAEPQTAPEACPDGFQYNEFTGAAATWTQSGTAGGPSDNTRSTDTVVAIFQDPASVSPATNTRYSVQVGSGQYQIGETLSFAESGGGTIASEIEDVYPPINSGTALTIQAIYYFSGINGRCVIVPSQFQVGAGTQMTVEGNPQGGLPFLPGQIAGLRRGALIQINSEVCFVLSVTTGPQNQLAIEVVTVGSHGAGETIIGIPAICCSGLSALVVGQTVTATDIFSAVTNGVGMITQFLSPNPFNLSLGTIGTPQEDDYIHVSFGVDVPASIIQLQILFDIGDGTFTENVLYFAINPSVLVSVLTQNQTQQQALQAQATGDAIDQTADSRNQLLDVTSTAPAAPATAETGANQFTEAIFPITDLTRIGNDQTKTLANCVAVQVLVNCSGTVIVQFGSIWVGGGGQPDVGDTGAPYLYRVRPRSALTGARGNPSPETRYGTLNRRQRNIISLPSAAYDPQIDTWDIERYGGSVTGLDAQGNAIWHLVGSASSSAATFVDNVFDSAAQIGEVLDFTNFEPWPTVDVPWSITVGSGGITAIAVVGTAILITGTIFPATIARWLPGTLVTLNGQVAYTLNQRPKQIGSNSFLLRIVENAGAPTVTTLVVNEPNVANQPLAYLWGPDSNGIVFGSGDPFRPGVLYSSAVNNPDSTPNNVYDLTPPSEPQMGGVIIDGLSLAASSKRWWQLQPAFNTPQQWNPVETPAGRGVAAPQGITTDGKFVYFVGKDGLYSMIPGLPAVSLTDVDLKNLFPSDGVPGVIPGQNVIYAGYTFYAPDYAYASRFRLSIINSILRFHYFDSSGFVRTMALDMSLDGHGQPRMAWSSDQYAANICASHQPPQPSGTLASSSASYGQGYFADVIGNVYIEQDLVNDNGVPISCVLGNPEWDAGDVRFTKQWLDSMVDLLPAAPAGVTVSPVSGGTAVGTPATIAQSAARIQSLNPIGNPISAFLGLIFSWIDDFTKQSVPTQIYQWSSEFVPQPVLIRSWNSVPTSHGMRSYHHIRKIVFAYLSTAPVTLTITAFDGTSPTVITLPSTSGAYQKVEFVPTFNKGLLYTYNATSPQPWAPILSDCEVHVGQWNRTGPYNVFTDLGGTEA